MIKCESFSVSSLRANIYYRALRYFNNSVRSSPAQERGGGTDNIQSSSSKNTMMRYTKWKRIKSNHYIHIIHLCWAGFTDTQIGMLPRISWERNVRSKSWWLTRFCNSHYVSHFAAFFIVVGAKTSVAEGCIKINTPNLDINNAMGDVTAKQKTENSSVPIHYCVNTNYIILLLFHPLTPFRFSSR